MKQNKLLVAALAATFLVGTALCIYFLRTRGFSEVYALFVLVLAVVGAEGLIGYASLQEQSLFGNRINPVVSIILVVLVSCVVGGVLELLTIVGIPRKGADFLAYLSVKRVLLFSAVSFLVLSVVVQWKPAFYASCFKSLVVRAKSALTKRRAVILLLCVGTGIIAACCFGVVRAASAPLVFFVTALLLVMIACVCYSWSSAGQHPERLFLSIALPLTLIMACCMPSQSNISWDDQTHYRNSQGMSYLADPWYSDADLALMDPVNKGSLIGMPLLQGMDTADDAWSTNKVAAYHDELANVSNTGAQYLTEGFSAAYWTSTMQVFCVGYIPSAIGLWIGRLLQLPLAGVVVLGRIMNALFYCAIAYLSIRITPVKKALFCIVGLLPTCLFLSANYSYDSWLIVMLMLGFALVLNEACSDKEQVSLPRIGIAMTVCFFALAPKAIYFPLLGFFFLIPKRKFASTKQYVLFVCGVVALALFIASSFALPFFESGGGAADDARGGSDVAGQSQLGFILEDPLRYIAIAGKFTVFDYLNVFQSSEYTMHFAYLGKISEVFWWLEPVPATALLICAVCDSDKLSKSLVGIKNNIGMLFCSLVTIALIVTALYISFTPVGSDTVNGCSLRYLIPLLVPSLAIGFNIPLPLAIDKAILARGSQVFMGSISLLGVSVLVLARLFA